MNLDAPIPAFKVPVTFADGSLAGQTVEVDNDCHHWLNDDPPEYYQRENYTTPEDPRTLRSRFVLLTAGYRARGQEKSVAETP